jgi:hypothetical protein
VIKRCSLTLVGLLATLGAAGCSQSPFERVPSGAVCPPDSTLTYENFGQPFMERYCIRCHSSQLHGAERNGAPLFHDFDSLMGIVVVADHIDEYTAAGPNSVNERMPPNGDKPTFEERTQLGEWLACELERVNDRPDAGPPPDAAPADAAPADAAPPDAAP